MAFHIGEIYRYSSQNRRKTLPQKNIDGLPNFFYETYNPNAKSSVVFQKGIHNLASVRLPDGTKRIPAIIISSSPHKAGTDMTPWEDDFDPDHGHIRYYGDNKSYETKASLAPGNELLLNAFLTYSSPNIDDRMRNGVPLIFFQRVPYNGRLKGNLKFQGIGLIESVQLVTQFDPKLKNPYFPNYVFDMCVFSLAGENEEFSWDWISARQNPLLSTEEANKLAPSSWQEWIKYGSTGLFHVRRNVAITKIISASEQCPTSGSQEETILKSIYSFYQDRRHIFELLALRITQEIFEESGILFHPGWVTSKSGDRGIDFVGRLDISSQMSAMKVVVLGQAKCEDPHRPTNGLHIARTVARLKRGWFGVYVTTSFFSKNVQLEVIDDQYPIMLICGLKVAQTIEKILYKTGQTLMEFLKNLENDYHTETRRTEDILYS